MAEVAGPNPAEPTFIFKSTAELKAEDEHNRNEELHNFLPELHNFRITDDDDSQANIMTDRYYDEQGDEHIEMLLDEILSEDEINDLKNGIERRSLSEITSIQFNEDKSDKRASLTLSFGKAELDQYVAHRLEGLATKSRDWISRASEPLWDCTHGKLSVESMTRLRNFVLKKYTSIDSHRKVLGFAVAFLKFLAKTQVDPRYQSFEVYLELPKTVRARKAITKRIISREEIETVFKRIDTSAKNGKLSAEKARNYTAFALLAAYTGLRPSTVQRLKVGQLRAAVNEEKPTIHVLSEQEKNRVEHYVPLHPVVVTAVSEVLAHDFDEKDDDKPLFMFHSFEKWLERHKIPLARVRDSSKAHLWLSDFRKFAEQFGDVIGWDTTNRKYVLAHGMTGVDWEHYKHPLPEDVYDIYLRSWGDIDLTS